jgi:hypothetical protein
MTLAALVKMLNCVAADGRSAAHAIIEDSETKKILFSSSGAPLLKKITVSELRNNELLLLPDAGRANLGPATKAHMSPLLSTTSGTDQHRACDGALLRVLKTRPDGITPLEVGYFDLKSGNPDSYAGQFLSTHCFISYYVTALLTAFYGVKCKVTRERYVVFHTDKQNKIQPLKKKPSRPGSKSANSPRNAEKIIVRNGETVPTHRIL